MLSFNCMKELDYIKLAPNETQVMQLHEDVELAGATPVHETRDTEEHFFNLPTGTGSVTGPQTPVATEPTQTIRVLSPKEKKAQAKKIFWQDPNKYRVLWEAKMDTRKGGGK